MKFSFKRKEDLQFYGQQLDIFTSFKGFTFQSLLLHKLLNPQNFCYCTETNGVVATLFCCKGVFF